MTSPARAARSMLLAVGLLWPLGASTPSAAEREGSPPVPAASTSVLLVHLSPRMSPGLLALESAFRRTLTGAVAGPISFNSEYFELTTLEDEEPVLAQVADYLRAKYRHTRLDLVAVTSSNGLRFVVRHRDLLFPGVPVVFGAVDQAAAADVPLGEGVSGVWLNLDWAGTLDTALRLRPDTERAVVVTGASYFSRVWAAAARAQIEQLRRPVAVTYLIGPPMEDLLAHLATLPDRTVVLLGAFGRDATGREFRAPEVGTRIASASRVPVFALTAQNVGTGVVGGHVVDFTAQGSRQAEMGARMLRGERPAPDETGTNVYRFDARQLRRWDMDARRLPPASQVLFDEPSVWQAYRGSIVGAAILVVLQAWLIVGLLVSRAKRRRAERGIAEQLRFETLVSSVLATLVAPATADETPVERALALIGTSLDVDQIVLAERNQAARAADVTHAWIREGVAPLPASLEWSAFPWLSRRLGENRVIAVSPRHPLPAEAETDHRNLVALGLRSLVAVPLILEGAVAGFLTFATLRAAREWPDGLIERCRLLAEVFAHTLARQRAEAAARESGERSRRQREELAHALRVNTLGEFGVSLAHEINQPLTAITLNARAMTGLLAGGPAERATAAEALGDIAADAKRAGAIVHRLRALSRKEHTRRTGLDLDALIDEVTTLLHQDFVHKGITVQRAGARDLPPVSGDPIQLQQVFLNVLVNAGEAIIAAGPGAREITVVSTHPAPGLVEVAIGDTGIGAKDVDLEHMFQSFVTTKPSGLGMGLAISRSIVEAHGGRIFAKANADRGLTMHVELPAQEDAA